MTTKFTHQHFVLHMWHKSKGAFIKSANHNWGFYDLPHRTKLLWQKSLPNLVNFNKLPNFTCQTFSNSTNIIGILIFKPGVRNRRPRARLVSWNCFGPCVSMCARACVCVSVCLPPRPLITSGVIWCDIGRVRLVKQVLRLSPAFN